MRILASRLLFALTCAWLVPNALCTAVYPCIVDDSHVEDDSFRMAARSGRTLIFTHPSEPSLVHIAAKSFAEDVTKVIEGGNASVAVHNVSGIDDLMDRIKDTSDTGSDRIIVAGSLSGEGRALSSAIAKKSGESLDGMRGKWEAWDIRPVRIPMGSTKRKMLLVTGADARGLAYALFTMSEEMGVSPWHWFADVPIKTRKTIVTRACSQGSPAVKYRGIFLNDEQPALTNWANKYFKTGNTEQSTAAMQQSFLPIFYEKLFDLLIRMRANMFWPAMWADMFAVAGLEALPNNGTNGTDAAGPNQVLADRYGLFYSTSHQEPMARNTPEWTRYGKGAWDYSTNSAELQRFWAYGAQRAQPYSTLFTVGMRGNGDIPLPGANIKLLEQIVKDQRRILVETQVGKNITEIPQFWCLYKEVQSYYDADGLQVPDDVMLLWTDDNWGNLRRVPRLNETSRAGGSGLYYHFDYVGNPRNYKWISTINFAKTWEQLNVAQQTGMDRMLILNVGDLKPIEVATHYAMSLSYYGTTDERIMKVQNDSSIDVMPWVEQWATRTFPTLSAKDVVRIVTGYNALNNKIKPELLNSTTWSFSMYDEAESVSAEWKSIINLVDKLSKRVKGSEYDSAFEQLISTPARLSANLNELYMAVGRANLMVTQARSSANIWKTKAESYFKMDSDLTKAYHSLLDGKWDGTLNQPHINYQYWQQPMRNTMPPVAMMSKYDAWPMADGYTTGAQTEPILIVQEGSEGSWPGDNQDNCAQGYSCGGPFLSMMDRYNAPSRWFEVASGTWIDSYFTLEANASWVKLSSTNGHIKGDGSTDKKIWASVDWDIIESNEGIKYGGVTVYPSNGTWTKSPSITITVPVDTSMIQTNDRRGAFIGGQGMVSMHAKNATSMHKAPSGNASWFSIPGYGMTGNAVTTLPPTHQTFAAGEGPSLSFDFYLNATSKDLNVTTYLPPLFNYHAGDPLNYALQLDGGDPVTVQPIPLSSTAGGDPPDQTSVLAMGMRVTTTLIKMGSNANSSEGWHSLRLWAMQPGIVLEKIAIGNYPQTTLPPPQSYRIID